MRGEWNTDWETVYQTLASTRQRAILSYVRERSDSISVDDIAAFLAGDERCSFNSVTGARIDLYHVHLPKLDEAGLLEWNGTDEVRPSAFLDRLPTDLVSPRIQPAGRARSESD